MTTEICNSEKGTKFSLIELVKIILSLKVYNYAEADIYLTILKTS